MSMVYDRIINIKGNLLTIKAPRAALGELIRLEKEGGGFAIGSVLSIDGEYVVVQLFENPRGVRVDSKITFLDREMTVPYTPTLLGRCLNGSGEPIDGGPKMFGEAIELNKPSFNPVKRTMPNKLVRTNIPMIDLFNCLVKSQKIPIFSTPGEPYNELLMRIANQTDAQVVIIGGMGLRFDDYQAFVDNADLDKTVMFIHKATDPVVECILVPDMALAVAERFALENKDVLVLLTDMTAFADALKEIAITMNQVPSNRGYPGSLYSDLAARYEKAVDIDGHGSITILSVTTMPGGDVTHPVPDNTGYITEGQFYLSEGRIDPFGSLSRLKQLVIGKETRQDHGDLANAMIRLYADSKKAKERQSMGFRLTAWDKKLLTYAHDFEREMMDLSVNIPLEKALDLGWDILARSFTESETGIKKSIVDKHWIKK